MKKTKSTLSIELSEKSKESSAFSTDYYVPRNACDQEKRISQFLEQEGIY